MRRQENSEERALRARTQDIAQELRKFLRKRGVEFATKSSSHIVRGWTDITSSGVEVRVPYPGMIDINFLTRWTRSETAKAADELQRREVEEALGAYSREAGQAVEERRGEFSPATSNWSIRVR